MDWSPAAIPAAMTSTYDKDGFADSANGGVSMAGPRMFSTRLIGQA
jgi:hypothetical protein